MDNEDVEIIKLELGPLLTNCYIIVSNSKDAIIIDPAAQPEKIIRKINKLNINPIKIINTHCHIDHIAAAYELQQKFNLPFFIHKDDAYLVNNTYINGELFGFGKVRTPSISGYLDEEIIELNKIRIKVIHTPGHTLGSISLYIIDKNKVFVGDTLFAGSIGRTDLPGGSYQQIIKSIKEKLFTLPEETQVYPGHGPITTIGEEKVSNPFL
jgi:glyoxylase-like metal-dependent hydrolase (beta-lactamase superfamily II)